MPTALEHALARFRPGLMTVAIPPGRISAAECRAATEQWLGRRSPRFVKTRHAEYVVASGLGRLHNVRCLSVLKGRSRIAPPASCDTWR